MTWTKEQPAVGGHYYWWRRAPGERACVLWVDRDRLIEVTVLPMDALKPGFSWAGWSKCVHVDQVNGGEWFGPLEAPP